jgi:transposase
VESGYRKMRCLKCRFEADRDIIAILNIERKAKMWGALIPLNASQMTDVNPNRCGEPSPFRARGGQHKVFIK